MKGDDSIDGIFLVEPEDKHIWLEQGWYYRDRMEYIHGPFTNEIAAKQFRESALGEIFWAGKP